MQERATQTDIAKKLGCSKTTVSLALRNSAKISAERRRLIQTAARQLNYIPDPALSRIAACRWRDRPDSSRPTVAFLTAPVEGCDATQVLALDAAKARAKSMGYRFEHHALDAYESMQHLGKVLYSRGIEGVVLGQLGSHDISTELQWDRFCVVGCDPHNPQLPIHKVEPDLSTGLRAAWQCALERGYRRIGLVIPDAPSSHLNLHCVFSQLQESLPAGQVIPIMHLKPDSRCRFARWMEHFSPEIVFGISLQVRRDIEALGWIVPDLVAFANLAISDPVDLSSGICIDYGQLGSAAVELLDQLLHRRSMGIPSVRFNHLLVPSWRDGDSARTMNNPIPHRSTTYQYRQPA
ncbi:LacI family DNA-binding transcriptional regulator [Nibricoccus sp. IMCC34717]|uniref:LacI family DNA-binding transcriptional regulator n=1 Tax=Nibricoccus sp. IMCC34717 TaxID=3034021 RepID=UPI00384EB8FB